MEKAKAGIGDMVLVENDRMHLVERTVIEVAHYAGDGGGFGEKFFYRIDRPLRLFGSSWVTDYRVKALIARRRGE